MSDIEAILIDSGPFTPKEAEIAQLMCEGEPNKVIANRLAISIRTVDAHTQTMYEKLNLRNQSINTRCVAILTMVAKGMVQLSVKTLVAILIFNTVLLDDECLRAKHHQKSCRTRLSHRARRADDI